MKRGRLLTSDFRLQAFWLHQPYHANRNPSCPFRASSAVVIVPTVRFEMLASGVPKLLWLNTLNTSARNSARARPIGKRLLSDRFTCCVPGPRTVLRPAVPCVPAAGTEYAVLSNQWSGVGLSMLPNTPGVIRFTRCGRNDPHWQTLVDVIENGKPLPRRTMPCTCHPPSKYDAGPPLDSHVFPAPNGR